MKDIVKSEQSVAALFRMRLKEELSAMPEWSMRISMTKPVLCLQPRLIYESGVLKSISGGAGKGILVGVIQYVRTVKLHIRSYFNNSDWFHHTDKPI